MVNVFSVFYRNKKEGNFDDKLEELEKKVGNVRYLIDVFLSSIQYELQVFLF